MNKLIMGTLWLLALVGGLPAESLSPKEIMKKVEVRDLGDKASSTIELTMSDAQGRERIRRLTSISMDDGTNRWTRMRFIDPPDLFNTGFLSHDYRRDEQADEQWLYLSALAKTRRIASTDKSKSFMGTDFSYYDLTLFNADRFTYTLLGEETQKVCHGTGEITLWKIKAVPVSSDVIAETGYVESTFWVRRDPYVIIRAVHMLEKKGREKRFEVRSLEQIDDIWIEAETFMASYVDGKLDHGTVFKQTEVKFNQDLSEDLFSVRGLERGR